MSQTRLLAVKALIEIFNRGGRPKQTIETLAQSLDKRDRSFLMEIVYGTVRFRDTLDWLLRHFLKDPLHLGDFSRNNLRAALYQIHFMRVPDRAVVHEAVELEKFSFHGKPSGKAGLVNAVLRNMLRQRQQFLLPFAIPDPAASLAVNTSHPEWLTKRWIERFGAEEAALLAHANNIVPPLTLRVNTLKTSREELLGMLRDREIGCAPAAYSPDGIVIKEARSYEDLSFARGLFSVQDEASQLISFLLGPKPGERILDACAAPGGKTSHIAQLMGDSGEVIAVEKSVERISRLRENIGSLGIRSVTIVNADAATLKEEGTFDRILVDAPCSATGVIRRNPDVKYRHSPGDLDRYRSVQLDLLRSLAPMLKKDGLIVYSVCSTEPEEGEEVLGEFLKTSEEFRIINADAAPLGPFVRGGIMRTYPHKHDMDGFFGVALCRQG